MPASRTTHSARPATGTYSARATVPVRKRAAGRRKQSIWGALLRIAAATVLPVFALVRVAVELYGSGYGTVTSIGVGAATALVILSIAAASIVYSLRSVIPIPQMSSRAKRGIRTRLVMAIARWVALPVVVTWCAYAMFYFASANAKTAEVRNAFTSLHPIVRLAVSTAILADGDLVVTDASRTAADYRRMGLPVFERTKHYRQSNGWVHAVDVRTIGHSEVRNFALAWYFRAVGLRVVRHIGTADHLHVELQ